MNLVLLQGGGGGGGMDMLSFPLMMIGVFAIMYFIAIRPQQKERKRLEEQRKGLKKGDRVLTQGGILAKVQQVKADGIVLDLDGSARMTVVPAAISQVIQDGEAAPKEQTAKA